MKWRTKISVHRKGDFYLRGYKLTDLIETRSFTETIFLVLRGRLPDKKEQLILNAILVAGIEHGIEVPSAFVARTVASTGNSTTAALAAGILSIGEWHGGAVEKAMTILRNGTPPQILVHKALSQGEKLPGYGHKIYKKGDPRTAALYHLAKKLKFGKKYLERARIIERELKRQAKRALPLNIDGAIAALLLELGFEWRLGKAFFALARMPGIMAHVEEELNDENPYRRFGPEDVEYVGPPLRRR